MNKFYYGSETYFSLIPVIPTGFIDSRPLHEQAVLNSLRASKTGLGRLFLLMKRHKFKTEILYDGSTGTITGISVNTDISQWSSLMYAYDQDIYCFML